MSAAAVAPLTHDPVDAAAQRRSYFLEANLQSLPIPPDTQAAIRAAEPRGKVDLQGDGTPFLRVGGQRFGMELSMTQVFAQLQDIPDDNVVLVFGMAAGQLPRIARAMCKVPIVVYDPDPALLRTLFEYGPLDLGSVIVVHGAQDLMRIWRDFAARITDVRVLTTPGYYAAYPEEVRAFVEVVPSLLQRSMMSKATLNNRAKIWIQDIIENVELLTAAPPFLTLRGRYQGVPAFIIGAGPSLDKNIDLLNMAAQKGIVFATNSGAVSLGKHGIEPQVVACLESIDASSKLRDLPFMDRAVRAYSLTAAPETLRTGKGPLMPVHEVVAQYDAPLEELTGQPGLPVSGSVSTMAFSLARFLGCSPLVLVGQDLAFTAGRTYASGTGYESSLARVDDRGVVHVDWNEEVLRVHGEEQGIARPREPHRRLPAWGGEGEVDSVASFDNVRDWFRRTSELLQKAGSTTRLINATEGGVHIPGFEDLPLAQVLEGLPERSITAATLAEHARSLWTPLSVATIRAWLEKQAEGCPGVRRAARRVRRYAQHASHVTLSGDPRLVRPAYDRLEQAESEIRDAVAACPLVDAWAHRAIHAALESNVDSADRDTHEGPHREAREATQRSARVARAVEQAARELERALFEGSARLAAVAAHRH
ncbi:MAG: hypothetical protein RL033_7464 [Pseudomonadota bacterium]|jgi:hypothetical protein